MKKLITKFEETGICEVDTEKVSKAWTNKFSISQYHEKFTLVKQYRGENCAKVQIAENQANEIIEKLKLLPIQSGLFRHAKTYRTESNIISEMERIQKIQTEKQNELGVINSIINEFKSALAKK